MRIFQILLAIKLVSSRKGTLLHLVENHLNIHKLTLANVYIDTGTKKFFHQYRHIETVGIKSRQIGSFNVIGNVFGNLLECGTIRYIGIINAMNGRRSFGNVHFRIDTQGFSLFIAVRIYFEITNFYDPVCVDIGTRCFQIKKNNRVL